MGEEIIENAEDAAQDLPADASVSDACSNCNGDDGDDNNDNKKKERQKEKAKDRRRRQQEETSIRKGKTEGTPRNNQAQNRQFKDVVKRGNLTKDQARRLHEEITKRNLNRKEVLERAKDLFPDKY